MNTIEPREYMPFYFGCRYKSTIKDVPDGEVVGFTINDICDFVDIRFKEPDGEELTLPTNAFDDIKLVLRPLESMTDEEAQECLMTVFLVPPHNAWMDVEALQQFLQRNIAFTIGVGEEEQGEIPMNMFELTPQTMFNLTQFLLSKHFDLFGLIEQGLAISKSEVSANG